MNVDAPRWQPVPFVLTYRLGEIPLFRKRFRGLALYEHFFDLTDDTDKPPPPLDRFAAGIDVIVTRSHPVKEALPAVRIRDHVLRYVLARYTRFHVDLSGDFDGYLAKFSAKSRSTLKRKVKRFLELGEGCEMRRFSRPEEMAKFHQLAREISALTYQEKLLDAGIPEKPEFVDKLIGMAEADSVRAYVLFLRGIPIAYLYCPVVNGVLLYAYLGYDPRHAEHSPGTVLQYLVFQSLFAEKRFRAFDFTEGQGEHKRFFATHETACADICYFPASFASRSWVGLHCGLDSASALAGRALAKVGLKARLKRFWRRR